MFSSASSRFIRISGRHLRHGVNLTSYKLRATGVIQTGQSGGSTVFRNTHRCFSSTTSPDTQQPLETEYGLHQGDKFAAVTKRAVVQVSGDDSSKFLQGLITNHMPKIDQGGSGFFTCFLAPQGRVMFDAFVYPKNFGSNFLHPVFLIETDIRARETLLKILRFYKLRSRVQFVDVSSEYSVWSVWGPGQEALIGKPDKPMKHLPRGSLIFKETEIEGTQIWQHDIRTPDMGLRLLLSADAKPKLPSSFSELDSDEYTLRRILKGVAEGADDYVMDQSLPLECNLDYMHGVDFNKGCYLGQELTIRSHHRGVVRKRVVPVIATRASSVHSHLDPNPPILDCNTDILMPPSQSEISWKTIVSNNSDPAGTGNQKDAAAAAPKRVRKTSPAKLGSSIFNAGLALMRLEHIEQFLLQTANKKAEQGPQHAFVMDDQKGSSLYLYPRIPSWWPR
ncbi:ccr4 associated factor [Mycoemilia scoparia]|uniref:Ccr4 associated factor n=1 Tax=Mycoemilia scoparia TaxID=417184 RepID=A0A9W8ABL4_9FUNG|nr:ccr4 associated factor [Mycoemilia scoparia]